MEIGRKIKQSFGNKIRGMEFYDIVEKTGHWSFKICFIAYNYFSVVFSYELDIIGFSIEVGNGKLLSVINEHNCYSNMDMDSYLQNVIEELELRIPDKYLKIHGWKQFYKSMSSLKESNKKFNYGQIIGMVLTEGDVIHVN